MLGSIAAYRQEMRPFSDKQIALLQNFAAQAVIAMENARLLTEQREALEQQTATAEVLQVINSSPGNLGPVFEEILEKAMHVCGASFGGLWTFQGDRYVVAALHNVPDAYADFLRGATMVPGPGSAPYRFLHGERSVIQNIDLAEEEIYRVGDPQRRALVDLGGARTALHVPLCKDDTVMGVVTIYRKEVRAFDERQISLLQNFAAQAVVAIENTRLLNELRNRTNDLQNHLNTKRPRASSWRSSAARLQTFNQCWIPFSRLQRGSVARALERLQFAAITPSASLQHLASRKKSRGRCFSAIITALTRWLAGPCLPVKSSMLRTCRPILSTTCQRLPAIGHLRTALGIPLLREGSRSALSSSAVIVSSPSRIGKSH